MRKQEGYGFVLGVVMALGIVLLATKVKSQTATKPLVVDSPPTDLSMLAGKWRPVGDPLPGVFPVTSIDILNNGTTLEATLKHRDKVLSEQHLSLVPSFSWISNTYNGKTTEVRARLVRDADMEVEAHYWSKKEDGSYEEKSETMLFERRKP